MFQYSPFIHVVNFLSLGTLGPKLKLIQLSDMGYVCWKQVGLETEINEVMCAKQ